jgi:hypothetical protein
MGLAPNPTPIDPRPAMSVTEITIHPSEEFPDRWSGTVGLVVNNIPMSERLIVRKAIGLPLEAFLGNENKVGEDTVVVLWWLARRASGEPMLTWTQAEKQWPVGLKPTDIELVERDPNGADDPEA